jgi:hypothetical protein
MVQLNWIIWILCMHIILFSHKSKYKILVNNLTTFIIIFFINEIIGHWYKMLNLSFFILGSVIQ